MKKLFSIALTCCFLTLAACSNDNDNINPNTNEAVEQAFNQKYPNTKATWEIEQGYYKAEFHENRKEKEAWFNPAGQWMLTETDISYQELPDAVKNHFEKSKYALWKVEDVDLLERPQMENIYVMEVEKGKTEFDLVYSASGILLKEIADDNNDDIHTPSVPSENIINAIKGMYPEALILEIEKEAQGYEVDILDKGVHKEVMLNTTNEWIYTQWEVLPSSLPAKIVEVISQLGYTQSHIDEVEIIEYKDGKTYYKVELEKGDVEKDIYFTADGNMVKNHPFQA